MFSTTPEVDEMIDAGAVVAVGVSGGKDSALCAYEVRDHLDRLGHSGPRLLIHADLGRIEWADSAPAVRRLAAELDWELAVVARKAGDMIQRWETRWTNNVARYRDLACVKLILPWSTPAMRFCTSEMKVAVICAELKRRYPGQTILSATGLRREESTARAKAPIVAPQKKLAVKRAGTIGYDWHPILDWSRAEVLRSLAARRHALHEAYGRFGSSRVSCAFCILAAGDDLAAAARDERNAAAYRMLVDLEVRSTFGFQSNRWLGDVALHLLDAATRSALVEAKDRAATREAAEARLAPHLLYVAGWPVAMPTRAEATLIGEVRREVAATVGIAVNYTEADTILGRYAELIAQRAESA